MPEKQTVLGSISVMQDGEIALRFELLEIDSGKVVSRKLHRTIIPPGLSARQQMAYVNQHFAAGVETKEGVVLRPNPVSEADIAAIEQRVSVEHTPAVVTNYKNKEAERKRNEGAKRA